MNRDDFVKLNLEFKDMLQKNFPGFENDLPLNRDWLGDERPKFSVFSSYTEDPINIEAAEIGYNPTPPRKKLTVTVDNVKTKFGTISYPIQVNVPLKSTEYALYQLSIGKETKENLTELLNTEEYKNSKDKLQKKDLMADEVSIAKRDVTEDFKSEDNPFWNDIYQRATKLAIKKWQEKNIIKAE